MSELGTAQVIRANARNLPLADNSVDLVVTSPPYFALRSYQDGGEHYAGQIGDEPTPAEFVDALLEVTRECVRVLKPSGSLWVNLGDKYQANANNGTPGSSDGLTGRSYDSVQRNYGFRPKTLLGIPWRYALRCIDDLSLILRAEVIWSKPNGLPESVTDRVRRSHEQWFHFTLEPRYFSAVDEIREPHAAEPKTSGMAKLDGRSGQAARTLTSVQNPLGKLPGSVWTVPTEPLRVPDHLGIDHFAAFPTEWPKRIIQGWSPAGVCVECGEGRRPVVAKSLQVDHAQRNAYRPGTIDGHKRWNVDVGADRVVGTTSATITGHACACGIQEGVTWTPSSSSPTAAESSTPTSTSSWTSSTTAGSTQCAAASVTPPPTRPAVVLDPFGGTGTTAMVAKALGRHGISVDMSADYCRLAQWRTNDRDQLAKVLGIAKAEQQPDDQLSMLDLLDGGAA